MEPAPAAQVSPFLSTVMSGGSPWRTQHRCSLSSGSVQLDARESIIHSAPLGHFTTRQRPSGPRENGIHGAGASFAESHFLASVAPPVDLLLKHLPVVFGFEAVAAGALCRPPRVLVGHIGLHHHHAAPAAFSPDNRGLADGRVGIVVGAVHRARVFARIAVSAQPDANPVRLLDKKRLHHATPRSLAASSARGPPASQRIRSRRTMASFRSLLPSMGAAGPSMASSSAKSPAARSRS